MTIGVLQHMLLRLAALRRNLEFGRAELPGGQDAQCIAAGLCQQHSSTHLSPGQVIQLEKKSGISRIEVQSGLIWLTGTPADRDVLLREGQCYQLPDQWPFVLESMLPTDVVFVRDPESP